MLSLFSLGLVAMDMVGTLRIVGFVVGIPLIIIWLVSVKNTTALFYEKKKIRATLIFGIPGVILLLLGIFLVATAAPMKSHVYVANNGSKDGRVELAGSTFEVPAGTWLLVEFRSKEEEYNAKGYMGDSLVFDTTMAGGSYMANLGGDKVLIAEEVSYSSSASGISEEDLFYEMLMDPGVLRFSETIIDDLYDFDKEAPNSLSVDASSSYGTLHKFDLSMTSTAALFQEFLDALGEDGEGYDSLMGSMGDSLTVGDSLSEEEED